MCIALLQVLIGFALILMAAWFGLNAKKCTVVNWLWVKVK
jgi:hypothetical protein